MTTKNYKPFDLNCALAGDPVVTKFNNSYEINKQTGCWIWSKSCFVQGYGRMCIFGKAHKAHRVSYSLFNGKIPKNKFVCHSCDNMKCVNPDHLWLGTRGENNTDRKNKDRSAMGINHGMGKLTNEEVIEIREILGKHRDIAKIYGVSHTTIGRIKRNERRSTVMAPKVKTYWINIFINKNSKEINTSSYTYSLRQNAVNAARDPAPAWEYIKTISFEVEE